MNRQTLIDTHCHLYLTPLLERLDQVLTEATKAGISRIIMPATRPHDWPVMSRIAAEHTLVLPAYGIHPAQAESVTDVDLRSLRAIARQGVAIGEIGLDGTYGGQELQEKLFKEQLQIAKECNLPVLIHCRKATGRVISILKQEFAGAQGGIIHAFSGSVETARQFAELGFAISLCGAITWPNSTRLRKIVADLPMEHLVLESDAPDMTPAPHQGQKNQPAWMLETARCLADLKGLEPAEIMQTTTLNVMGVIPQLKERPC